MIKIEMLKIVEIEADWMIYSNLQEKLQFSPELKFRVVVPNQLEGNPFLGKPQKGKGKNFTNI